MQIDKLNNGTQRQPLDYYLNSAIIQAELRAAPQLLAPSRRFPRARQPSRRGFPQESLRSRFPATPRRRRATCVSCAAQPICGVADAGRGLRATESGQQMPTHQGSQTVSSTNKRRMPDDEPSRDTGGQDGQPDSSLSDATSLDELFKAILGGDNADAAPSSLATTPTEESAPLAAAPIAAPPATPAPTAKIEQFPTRDTAAADASKPKPRGASDNARKKKSAAAPAATPAAIRPAAAPIPAPSFATPTAPVDTRAGSFTSANAANDVAPLPSRSIPVPVWAGLGAIAVVAVVGLMMMRSGNNSPSAPAATQVAQSTASSAPSATPAPTPAAASTTPAAAQTTTAAPTPASPAPAAPATTAPTAASPTPPAPSQTTAKTAAPQTPAANARTANTPPPATPTRATQTPTPQANTARNTSQPAAAAVTPAIVEAPAAAVPVAAPVAPPVAAPPPQVQAPAPQVQTPPARTAQETPAPTPAAPAAPVAAAPVTPPPAAAAPAVAQQVTREPVLVSSARPVYPEYARRTGTLGDVELDITIDESGRVTRATPVSGPTVLRASAVAAVQQWRYQPAAVNGAPVSSRRRVRVSFK